MSESKDVPVEMDPTEIERIISLVSCICEHYLEPNSSSKGYILARLQDVDAQDPNTREDNREQKAG